jgi:hypothetical protein
MSYFDLEKSNAGECCQFLHAEWLLWRDNQLETLDK